MLHAPIIFSQFWPKVWFINMSWLYCLPFQSLLNDSAWLQRRVSGLFGNLNISNKQCLPKLLNRDLIWHQNIWNEFLQTELGFPTGNARPGKVQGFQCTEYCSLNIGSSAVGNSCSITDAFSLAPFRILVLARLVCIDLVTAFITKLQSILGTKSHTCTHIAGVVYCVVLPTQWAEINSWKPIAILERMEYLHRSLERHNLTMIAKTTCSKYLTHFLYLPPNM